MSDGLGGVDEDEGSGGAGRLNEVFDGNGGAEGVGDVGEGEDFCFFAEEREEGGVVESAVVEDGDDLEGGSGALGEHLPRDDIGVVLEGGDDDFVSGAQSGGEDVGDEVDAVGGAGGEDDFVGRGGVEVTRDGFAGGFVGGGGLLGEVVGAAMDVGVGLLVVGAGGVEDGGRLLDGGGVVEVDKGLAVDLGGEDWKLVANCEGVEHGAKLESGGVRCKF